MKKMYKVVYLLFAALFCFLPACSKPMPKHAVDVFLEAPTNSSSFGLHEYVSMPVSGIKAKITAPPVADIDSFTNAELLVQETDVGGERESVLGIRLHVKADKWLKIYQASGEAIAEGRGEKRFFLVVDGQPVGYCRLRRQIRRDDLFFIVESRKNGNELVKELKDFCFMLNEYILERREYMKKLQR